jgi:hypothetical protein
MGQRLVQIETFLTTEGEQLIERLTQRTDGAAVTLAARTNEAAAAMEELHEYFRHPGNMSFQDAVRETELRYGEDGIIVAAAPLS